MDLARRGATTFDSIQGQGKVEAPRQDGNGRRGLTIRKRYVDPDHRVIRVDNRTDPVFTDNER